MQLINKTGITSICAYNSPTVNGNPATMDTLLVNNDLVCHKVHRHEPPVTANPLTVIHEDDDIIVVDKPTSIPVSLLLLSACNRDTDTPAQTHAYIILSSLIGTSLWQIQTQQCCVSAWKRAQREECA